MPLDKLAFADFRDNAYDEASAAEEHLHIFGHWPDPDASGKCQHDLHGRIRREMNGATIETHFDPTLIVSEDSVLAKERQERYDMIYQATKQFQQEIEEEDKIERMRRIGLIPNRLVY